MKNIINRYKDSSLLHQWAMNALVVFSLGFLIDYSILGISNGFDKTITQITADVSATILTWITNAEVSAYVERIGIQVCTEGNHCVYIGDACNGRNLYIIYIGLLISIPYGTVWNKSVFIIGGSILIFISNIIRIIALVLIIDVSFDMFGLLHHYIFQLLMYLLLFGLWNYYFKKTKIETKESGGI